MKLSVKGNENSEEAMGQFGRITKLSDLPNEKTILKYIKEAMKLQDSGVKAPAKPKPKEKKEFIIPDYFMAALKKNKKALATFENFNYSNKKEYIEWITEAKSEETRTKRLATAVEWIVGRSSQFWFCRVLFLYSARWRSAPRNR